MAPRHAVAVVALAMLVLLCGPDLVSGCICCALDRLLQLLREPSSLMREHAAHRSPLAACSKIAASATSLSTRAVAGATQTAPVSQVQ